MLFLLQGLRELRSDEITLLLEPRAAVLVKGAQPTRPDVAVRGYPSTKHDAVLCRLRNFERSV